MEFEQQTCMLQEGSIPSG